MTNESEESASHRDKQGRSLGVGNRTGYKPERSGRGPTGDWREPSATKASSGRILTYGCIGIFVVGLFMILCAGFGTYFYLTKQVEKFTAEVPIEISSVEYAPEQLSELEAKMEQLEQSLRSAEQETDTLTSPETREADEPTSKSGTSKKNAQFALTADDINAMIAMEPKLKGKLFVKIVDDKVVGDFSVPTEGLIPGGKGRFLNGSGTFAIELENGNLNVHLVAAEVKGDPLPPHLIKEIRKRNLASDFQMQPNGEALIAQMKSIQIQDDQIVITIKNSGTGMGDTIPNDPETD